MARKNKGISKTKRSDPAGIHLTGIGAARLASPSRAYRPTEAMRRALEIVLETPALVSNKSALARTAGISRETIRLWHQDADFRRWWNAGLIDIARERMGEAALGLYNLFESSTSDVARVRAIGELLRMFGQPSSGVAEAVTAILEKYGRGRARIVGTPDGTTAIEIDASPHPTADDCGTSDNSSSVKLEVDPAPRTPPPAAMNVSSSTREALEAKERNRARRYDSTTPIEVEQEGGPPHRRGWDDSHPLPTPSRGRPRVALEGGAVRNHNSVDREQQDSAGTIRPENAAPLEPGQVRDFLGRPYVPREGDKPPPSPDEHVEEDPFL